MSIATAAPVVPGKHTARNLELTSEVAYFLPQGLLHQGYDYPRSFAFYLRRSTMTAACHSLGMNGRLIDAMISVECLLQDACNWLGARVPIPGMRSISGTCFLSLWVASCGLILETESSFSAAENSVTICLFIVTFLVCSERSSRFSSVPGILDRLRKYLYVPDVSLYLKAAGVDVWVATLAFVISKGNPEYEEHFLGKHLKILAERTPRISSFGDLRAALSAGISVP
ncbi:hypothetical protein GQ53DRAFT_835632 [Thozetella sp. PMI_491]|nr:hypothetical protein GQ53DRAFT_835632 [Thozetella sp. PMI_491]